MFEPAQSRHHHIPSRFLRGSVVSFFAQVHTSLFDVQSSSAAHVSYTVADGTVHSCAHPGGFACPMGASLPTAFSRLRCQASDNASRNSQKAESGAESQVHMVVLVPPAALVT